MKIPQIMAISASVGGPVTFLVRLEGGGPYVTVVSWSALIQNTLLPALLTGSAVEVELEPDSNVIKRVNPVPPKDPSDVEDPDYFGKYFVSRIATQRKPDGSDEHLEVFLKFGEAGQERSHNLSDILLQQIAIAAYTWKRSCGVLLVPVDIHFNNGDIATVTIGERYDPQADQEG